MDPPPTHAVTKIWRKGRERPLAYTALMSEWKMNSNPNWNSRPRHMLGLRSLKHCARQIIHGIPYDVDDRDIINITTSASNGPKPSLQSLIGAPDAKTEQLAQKFAGEPGGEPPVELVKAMEATAPTLPETATPTQAPGSHSTATTARPSSGEPVPASPGATFAAAAKAKKPAAAGPVPDDWRDAEAPK